MNSTPDHKPSSSWFSSLRRQAKPKPPKNNGKELQKSCLELSTIPTDNPAGNNDPLKIRRNQIFSRHYECPNATISKTIEIDHVKHISESDRTCDLRADGKANSDRSRNGSTGEYKVTTTTTTTKVIQTTVITKQSHRVGLVFNDSGELISNLDSLRNLNTNNKFSQLVSACNNNNNNSAKPSILDNDFDFIDDASHSGSEGQINRLQAKNKCSTCHNQIKSKSDWNLSVNKVNNSISSVLVIEMICFSLVFNLVIIINNKLVTKTGKAVADAATTTRTIQYLAYVLLTHP